MIKDVDYLLTGLVNGNYLEVNGRGDVDQSKGTMNLELSVIHAPRSWDPGLILLICCQNLKFYSANLSNTPNLIDLRNSMNTLRFGNHVNSQRTGFIKGPDGNYVAGMKAKGFLFINNNKIESKSVVLEGFSELDKFKGIKYIPEYNEIIRPTIKGCADGLSVYEIECNDGTILEGHTNYPYVFGEGQSLNEEVTLKINESSLNSLEYFENGVNPKLYFKAESI